jgi:putative heme-binding domain-containing protein
VQDHRAHEGQHEQARLVASRSSGLESRQVHTGQRSTPTARAEDEVRADDLKPVGTHRNFARGQQTFTALACAQCHQLGKAGTAFGPNLTDVVAKYKGDAKALLQEILEPSKNIEEKFRNVTLELSDENSLSGLVLAEDKDSVTIQAGPAANQIQKLAKSAIKSRKASALSIMPAALLNTLDKEQVLDLLAFILAGGNADHAAFKHGLQ